MAKQEPIFGHDNPHPLSTRKTELVWEGKYDEFGNRREVDIAGCAMPMQKIETIDEPASRLNPSASLIQKKPTKTTSAICSSGATTSLLWQACLKISKAGLTSSA
jgi:hypothetical protein